MDLKDMFKKPEPPAEKTEETKQDQQGKEGDDSSPKEELLELEEEDFETKSKRLAQAVEDAREGQDLGDIPARDDHPYHLAVKEHRLHESKRKR